MTADLVTRIVVAWTLAVALFGMVTRLFVPMARAWWTRQTVAAEQQVRALQAIPLTAHGRHTRRHFRRAA